MSADLGQMKELLLALQPKADALEPPLHSDVAVEDIFSMRLQIHTLVTLWGSRSSGPRGYLLILQLRALLMGQRILLWGVSLVGL